MLISSGEFLSSLPRLLCPDIVVNILTANGIPGYSVSVLDSAQSRHCFLKVGECKAINPSPSPSSFLPFSLPLHQPSDPNVNHQGTCKELALPHSNYIFDMSAWYDTKAPHQKKKKTCARARSAPSPGVCKRSGTHARTHACTQAEVCSCSIA